MPQSTTPSAGSPGELVHRAVARRPGVTRAGQAARVALAVAAVLAFRPAASVAQGLSTDDDRGGRRAESTREERPAGGKNAKSSKGARSAKAGAARPTISSTVRARAERDRGYRIVISVEDRQLWVISQQDTLLAAPVAVGSGAKLTGLNRTWVFETPKGVRKVVGKRTNPVWTPPDWMYVETAKENGLGIQVLKTNKAHTLADGRKLVVRGDVVGVQGLDGTFTPEPPGDHIIYDETLFVPPLGTKNRRIERELGQFALDTGDGYLLHGTPYEGTIGQRVSHGCVRLRNEDIAWLHRYVPVGTRVYLY